MSDNPLTRLARIASEILPGQPMEVTSQGEGYYVFSLAGRLGPPSSLHPIWLDLNSSDRQIHDRLSHEFELAFHPDSSPDDLSVPNLQDEASHPRRSD